MLLLSRQSRSAAERTSGVRFGTELSGRVIELSVQDPNSGEQVVTTRVLGKITSGMVTGCALPRALSSAREHACISLHGYLKNIGTAMLYHAVVQPSFG